MTVQNQSKFNLKVTKGVQIHGYSKKSTTVKSLASQIIKACDYYIELKVPEKQLKEFITHYASRHGKKLFAHNGLNPTVVNRIGKRRVELVNLMLSGFQNKLWD